MKNIKYIISNFALVLVTCISLQAQEKEVTVPFSDPSGNKEFAVRVMSGDVTIKGTDRSDVLVKYKIEEHEDEGEWKDDHWKNEGQSSGQKQKGMKKIGGKNFKFEIGEKNNTVYIKANNVMNMILFEIEVPREIDIVVSKQIGKNVYVENIKGALNIESNIGTITVKKLSGFINASGSTGGINVEFDEVSADEPMMFNTITGDIDLTLPASHKADLKMRTEWGDVYSDMNIETKIQEDNKEQSTDGGGTVKVSNSWTLGSLNGGGAQMTLKTQMGSIYLRKQ